MAEDVQIAGTQSAGKIRNPLGVIGLTLITLGIYSLVWYYKVNKEMSEIGRARGTDELGTSPGTSLLAVLIGWIIIVPPFVSTYNTCNRLRKTAATFGTRFTLDPTVLLWIVWIVFWPVAAYIFQRDLNDALRAQAGTGPAGEIPSAPVASPPPPAPAPADSMTGAAAAPIAASGDPLAQAPDAPAAPAPDAPGPLVEQPADGVPDVPPAAESGGLDAGNDPGGGDSGGGDSGGGSSD